MVRLIFLSSFSSLLGLFAATTVVARQDTCTFVSPCSFSRSSSMVALRESSGSGSATPTVTVGNGEATVMDVLKDKYPVFWELLVSKNEKVMKRLGQVKAEGGVTLFCPNPQAWQNLGDQRCAQLADPRNGEAAEKMAAYHVLDEPVTAEKLFNSGGVITMADGEPVPVGRTVKGGFFGMIGGTEDGGVTVNGAKVVQSWQVPGDGGGSILHEVDKIISPELLWRYVDQLRIPGSR